MRRWERPRKSHDEPPSGGFCFGAQTTPQREVMFDQAKADAICQRLADGMSLRKACEAEGGPDPSTILRWVEKYPEFAQQYTQVRARAYQLLADEILEISDDASRDVIQTENGPKVDAEVVARSRLRVDSRKWMLSKMLPKVYGDRLTLDGDPDKPLHTVTRIELAALTKA